MLEKSLPYKGFSLVIFSVHVVCLLRMSDTCDNSRKEGKEVWNYMIVHEMTCQMATT